MPALRLTLIFCFATFAAGCTVLSPEPGIGEPVNWSDLPGWENDRHSESWTALLRSCSKLRERPDWAALCSAAGDAEHPTDEQARVFYEHWFAAHPVYAEHGDQHGLVTGYYEPMLNGSELRSERYRYPVYGRPDDLYTVELADVYPELKGKRVRGRIEGQKIVPYPTRAELDSNPAILAGSEIAWVDDPIGLFFLHVQGSGRIRLSDERIIGVGYADQNGHAYRSIGRELIQRGELQREEVNLFSIREWLQKNPDEAGALLAHNPSYVFFSIRSAPEQGPYGSLNVPLVAERSIAVDPGVIPLGVPVWLDTTSPGEGRPYRRLVLAQDTGGAIKGHVRADLFWGLGERAERMAGLMKQQGRLFVLMPRAD